MLEIVTTTSANLRCSAADPAFIHVIRRIVCLGLSVALLVGLPVRISGAEGEATVAVPEVTSIEQLARIGTNVFALSPVPARVEAVIIFVSPSMRRLYVQEGEIGVQVNLTNSVSGFHVGQRVELTGKVEAFQPMPRFVSASARVLGEGSPPVPKESSAHRFALGRDLLRLVKLRGIVRDMRSERGGLGLLLTSEGLPFEYLIQSAPGPLPRDWLDAEIEAEGFAVASYTAAGKLIDFRFNTSTTNSIRLLQPGNPNFFDRPLLTIAEAARQPRAWQPRHKVAGTVTLHRGADLYIDDGKDVMHVSSMNLLYKPTQGESLPHEPQTPLQPGDRVEVIGVRQNWYFLAPMLLHAEYRRVGTGPPVQPVPVTPDDLKAGRFAGKLVSIRARLLNQRSWGERSTQRHLMVLQAGDEVFQATWAGDSPAKWDCKLDSYVRITGINEAQSGQIKDRITFELRLRGPEDLMAVPAPPFWARSGVRMPLLAGVSVAVVAGALILMQRRQMCRLRASEERFRALIEHSFDVTMVLNANGTVKYLSPSGTSLFGEISSKAGSGIASVVYPDDLPRILAAHNEVLKEPGRSQQVSRYRVVTQADGVRYAEAIGTNCLHVPGVEGVVVNLRDITERELAQQELERRVAERTSELVSANTRLTREIADRARAEKVQQALYAISEAIHGVDNLPSLYRRIHEIVGTLMPARNFFLALHDASTDVVTFPYHQDELDPPPPPRNGRRGMTEYVLRTGRAALAGLAEIQRLKDKGEYEQTGAPALIWLGVPLCGAGRPFGVMAVQDHRNPKAYDEEEKQILGFVAEQTALAIERKRAEHELKVALAAEKELNELKSTFVSMVSHEFRTPLEVILSSSNILDRYLDRLAPEKRAAQLRAIRTSVHRMSGLIDDVLLLAKFDAGRLSCNPASINLEIFCARTIAEVETAASREGAIQFHRAGAHADACADESLLQHILVNLLGNALKFSPPGQAVEFTLTRRGRDAEFAIRDCGCGIPEADQARLFTAFYRGSNTGHTHGTGLGLLIAKRCVDLHGGAIGCVSAAGTGTIFTVMLPIFEETPCFPLRVEEGKVRTPDDSELEPV